MARMVGRNVAGPLLLLNFAMYVIVLAIAGWALNKMINGHSHPYMAGNGATHYFVIFSLLAGAAGVASLLSGANHLRAWRSDSLSSAASSALIAWLLTTLAFGLACKEIGIGNRGRRLKTLEAFIIILTLTQLVYLVLLHVGLISSKYGPGYTDNPVHDPYAAPHTHTQTQSKTAVPTV